MQAMNTKHYQLDCTHQIKQKIFIRVHSILDKILWTYVAPMNLNIFIQ